MALPLTNTFTLDKLIVERVTELVRSKFSSMEGSHDWFHIQRVLKMSLHLQNIEGGNKEVVQLSALLHDISDHKYNGGDFEKGKEEAYNIIINEGGTKKLAHSVGLIIPQVSFKGALVDDEDMSIEGLIVRDADRLDAIGAMGIARAFAYGGSRNRPLYNPDVKPMNHTSKEEYLNSKSHTINHFYEKLLLLKDRMHTETAKKIAAHRQEIMMNYLEEFYAEWNVEIKD